MRRSPTVVLAALAVSGCATVGPVYRSPNIVAPRASDAARLAEWWRQFQDPVLDGLVTDALAANLELATARAQLREARARRHLAAAQLGPSVGASMSASYSGSSRAPGTSTELFNAGLDASWEPDIFGGVRRGLEAADADVGASTEMLRDTRVSLVAEVALNYVELRTAERRLEIAQASLTARSETYDLTRWRLQAGMVSELDVAQARTELESTRASLPALRTAVAEAKNRLAVLVGRAPRELRARLAATAVVPVPVAGQVAAGIPINTLRHRPDVRAAERRLAAQTARLGEARAARYPSLKLSSSIGLEALIGSPVATLWSLLGGVTAPIFNSGRISANIEVHDALLEQAVLAYQRAVLAALEDVEDALVAVANTGERRARLEEATASARDTALIAEQRYQSGLSDFLSVLDGQRNLLNLEDQLAISTGDLARAQIRLYKALGGGWSPELETGRKGDPS